MDTFSQCFTVVIGSEGGYSDNWHDPGNWTGGQVGIGLCAGTKYGISAAAYPKLNIRALEEDDAKVLYRRDYWAPIIGDMLPAPLALLVFDAGVNNGVHRALIWLQQALGVPEDGIVGPATLAAIGNIARGPDGGADLCVRYLTRRLVFMVSLPSWSLFGEGWAERLFRLPYQSFTIGADRS